MTGVCIVPGCRRETARAGSADRFALCPTCTDRILAGRPVASSTPASEGHNPPALARSGGSTVPAAVVRST